MSDAGRYLDPELIEQLNQLQLSARRVVEGTTSGQHRSPVKGASIEFRQHRFYVPGDEPRRVDWRILARTDRLYVKEYDEETNLRCVLVVDCSGSMVYGKGRGARGEGQGGESKFDYAAKLTASLAYLMLGQTESVGMATTGGEEAQWLGPHAGSGQLARMMEILENATPRGVSELGLTLRQVGGRLGRRSLVVVVSDFFTPVATLRQGLARLRHGHHEVIALRVLDLDEIQFPFKSWCQFRGLEGERARLCEPAMVRRSYLDAFERHRTELEQACGAMGVELHTLSTDRPLVDSLIAFLRHREVKGQRGRSNGKQANR